MDALDAVWHFLNLFAPAAAVPALAVTMAKLLWWRELRAAGWLRLWAVPAVTAAVVTAGGLAVLGRDGAMLTYGAMVASCALALWFIAFGPLRR